MRSTPSAMLSLALFGLVACGDDAPSAVRGGDDTAGPEVTDEIAEPERAPPPTRGQRRMHDRYDAVEALRGAIVRGDLAVARALARGMDRPVDPEDLPESARALFDVVPIRARAVADADTPEATAAAFADLARGCGECHEAADATWSFVDHPPPEGEDLPEHMRRHDWGVTRMWEALLTSDAERFDLGARALEEAPLTGDAPLAPEQEHPPGLSQLAVRLHRRAHDARAAADMRERAQIYGDLLVLCSECHARIERLDAEGE